MTEITPFQVQGEMSQVAACLIVFRELAPADGWVSMQDLHARVQELTATEVGLASLKGAAWHAGETLVREGQLGVDYYMGGYKRHNAESLADSAEVRLDRAVRDLSRMDTRVNAALQQPELPPWKTHRLQHLQSNKVKQVALQARRQNRHRPLPPGEGA